MQDDKIDVEDEAAPTLENVDRAGIFAALTGRAHAVDVSGTGERVESMLGALVGTSSRTKGLDTAAAAKLLDVSQRTVQRWLKAEREGRSAGIKEENLSHLRTRSRQASSTKRGRRRAVRGMRPRRGEGLVKVNLYGRQGPRRESDPTGRKRSDYVRDRWSRNELTPDQYERMMHAWEEGGEEGMLRYLETIWSGKYDDWSFYSLDEIEIG